MSTTLGELARMLDGNLVGDPDIEIDGVAEIESAEPGQVTFLANVRYRKYLSTTKATAVIVNEKIDDADLPMIVVPDAHVAKAKAIEYFYPPEELESVIDASAKVHPDAEVADDCIISPCAVIGRGAVVGAGGRIGAGAVIADDVTLGEGCTIGENASILHGTEIGNRVEIGAGTVIGSEGFGFIPDGDGIRKVPQVGTVKIGDDVRIGANCCIDRATLGKTILGKGVKLDNLIQIAHNVEIGDYTVMAGQSGVAGSTRIGKGVMVGGQAAIGGHIELGDGVKVAGKAGVSKSFPAGVTISGMPARENRETLKRDAHAARVPKLYEKLKELENQITELRETTKGND